MWSHKPADQGQGGSRNKSGSGNPPYNNLLARQWYAAKSCEYFAAYIKHQPDFEAEYQTYLQSEDWQLLREQVFSRSERKCEICSDNQAEEVHHTTYKRVGEEYISDLLAVCNLCHGLLHNKEPL